MIHHGDTGDLLLGIHADDHLDEALRAAGRQLHSVAGRLAVEGDRVHLLQRTAHFLGGVHDLLRNGGDLVVCTAGLGDGLQSRLSSGGVHGGDLVGGDAVDQTQQQSHHQRDDGQCTGDLQNKLTGDLHFAAASFLSFLMAP